MAVITLPLGYGFSPTETELILFFLKNKVMGEKLNTGHYEIPEVDLYKFSPAAIFEKCLKSRIQHGYFFCQPERKFASGFRIKRSTDIGQWKTTGKDTNIMDGSQIVGNRRTLVFYDRSSHAGRMKWVLYEYSLSDQQLGDSGVPKNGYVLCELFKKSSSDANDDGPCVEGWNADAYSFSIELIQNSYLTGGLRPDQPCPLKDAMEERVSHVPVNTDDFPGVTSEVSSHSVSLSSHKTNGQQHGSFSFEESYEFDADMSIASDVSSFHQMLTVTHLSSKCDKDSLDLERTLLNCPSDDVDGCFSQQNTFASVQQETTIPNASSLIICSNNDNNGCYCLQKCPCNHPPKLTHGSYNSASNILPTEEPHPIGEPCYYSLQYDQHQQQHGVAFMDAMTYNPSAAACGKQCFLPPGCRFSPTEIELILFYLKNKVQGRKLTVVDKVIPEVDLYKFSPWEISEIFLKLPGHFFCRHERKFASSSRKRRSTTTGQWRTTGKDKKIIQRSQTVGLRRTLVFYLRSLQVKKTNWFIYEYSLCDQQLCDSSIKSCYVICKLFKKSRSNPNDDETNIVDGWENDPCSDDNAFVQNSLLIGGSGPDISFSTMGTMEERVTCVSNNTNFTSDFPGVTSQAVTPHSGSLSLSKTNGQQHSSFPPEEEYEVDADISTTSNFSSFYQTIPVIHSSSECDEVTFDLERALLNCPQDDVDGFSSQQENTISGVQQENIIPSSCNRLSELASPEFKSHENPNDEFILPDEERHSIDDKCYCTLDID